VTPDTPRIPLLLDKWRRRIKRITALRAKEVTHMPLSATSNNDLALNGRLAALAPRREEFVEVEMAVEAHALVHAVLGFEALHVFVCWVRRKELDVFAALARVDAGHALEALVVGLGVEGYGF
jgi:hypothetical protein